MHITTWLTNMLLPEATQLDLDFCTYYEETEFHGVMGDESVPSVAIANCLAARFALIAMVAVIQGLWWCVPWRITHTQTHFQLQSCCFPIFCCFLMAFNLSRQNDINQYC